MAVDGNDRRHRVAALNRLAGSDLPEAALAGAAAAVEILLAATIIRRLAGDRLNPESTRLQLAILVGAALAGPAVGAAIVTLPASGPMPHRCSSGSIACWRTASAR